MTGIAKLRLGFYQQEFPGWRMMRRMARDATDIAPSMFGIDGVHLLRAGRVAGQAAGVDFLGRMVLEDKNLRLIAAAGNVGRPGTMAPLAALLRGASVCVVHCLPVRSLLVIVIEILMAGFACIRPDIIGNIRSAAWVLIRI